MLTTQAIQTEISEEHVLHFVDGIPGFPSSRRFALVDVGEDSAFQYLQSLDESDVAMVVTVPWLFFPDYAPELSEVERGDLGLERPEDAVVFCAVTLEPDNDRIYLNLLGPFIVNAKTRQGKQIVLAHSGYPVRAPIELQTA